MLEAFSCYFSDWSVRHMFVNQLHPLRVFCIFGRFYFLCFAAFSSVFNLFSAFSSVFSLFSLYPRHYGRMSIEEEEEKWIISGEEMRIIRARVLRRNLWRQWQVLLTLQKPDSGRRLAHSASKKVLAWWEKITFRILGHEVINSIKHGLGFTRGLPALVDANSFCK